MIIILHLAISLFFPLKINCFHAVNRPGKQISNASFVFWVSQLKITHSGHFHSSRFFGSKMDTGDTILSVYKVHISLTENCIQDVSVL